MKVYCVQYDIAWEDKLASHAKVRRMLENASPERGALVLLPEMFSTGFSMNVASIHDADGEDQAFLAEMAQSLGIYLMGGIVLRQDDGKGLNLAITCSPDGREISRYAKLHPFAPAREAAHYDAGDAIELFACGGFTVSPFICYDLRFPEAFRLATRSGATLLTVIANWPETRIEQWVTLLKARAIENQCYVAAVNRCGRDPSLTYPGRSLIVDPRGQVLTDGGSDKCVIEAALDPVLVSQWREQFPFLADMRPALLGPAPGGEG
jgi:predicted amidohydrolase